MRKKSHILLARYLADQMPANISLQSHRKAFCLGNILPDIQPSFVTKRHEYFGTFDEVQEKIILLFLITGLLMARFDSTIATRRTSRMN